MSNVYGVDISEFELLLSEAIEAHRNTDDPIPELFKDSLSKVENCLITPFQNVFGKELYPTVYDKAAILIYLFIKNHPLANGNKRMAFITMSFLLYKNGIELNMSNEKVYDFTKKIASSNANDKDLIFNYIKQTLIPMTKIEELEEKIKKAKANTMLPEGLKKTYIEKFEKELNALKPVKEEPKEEPVKKVAAKKVAPVKKATPVKKAAPAKKVVAKSEEDSLEFYKNILRNIEKYPKYNKKNVEKVIAELESALKVEPAKKPSSTKEKDCEDVIKEQKEKSKRAAELAKKSAHTPVVKKDEKAVEKIVERIEKHYKSGELTKAQITALIKDLTEKIEELKELLKTAPDKMGKGGGVFQTYEIFHSPSQLRIKFNKKGDVVERVMEWGGKEKNEITIDGVLYIKNKVHGTFNSITKNEILTKHNFKKSDF